MLPKELRRLVKKYKGNITHRPCFNTTYNVSGFSMTFARLVEENKKLVAEDLHMYNTCREEFAGNFVELWRGVCKDNQMTCPDGRVLRDRGKYVNPSNSVVIVLSGANYDNLRRTIKVLNRKELVAKWGTTSFVDLGSIYGNEGYVEARPGVLVIASRNWVQTIPHISLFTLLLRIFSVWPIEPAETDTHYWNRLRDIDFRDGDKLNSFLKISDDPILMLMKNARNLGGKVVHEQMDVYSKQDGINRVATRTAELIEAARSLRTSNKTLEEAVKEADGIAASYITPMHSDVCSEFAKLILEK